MPMRGGARGILMLASVARGPAALVPHPNEGPARSTRRCETQRHIWSIHPDERGTRYGDRARVPCAKTIENLVVLQNSSFHLSCASRAHHTLRLFAKNLTSAKSADFYFRFTPPHHLCDLSDAQILAILQHQHH